MTEKPKKKKTITKQAQGGAESKLEQLEKLNALLEKGYITKEEFDAKKKQIMKAETRWRNNLIKEIWADTQIKTAPPLQFRRGCGIL